MREPDLEAFHRPRERQPSERRPYRQPAVEPRGQIRPSLQGSPPPPPGTKIGILWW